MAEWRNWLIRTRLKILSIKLGRGSSPLSAINKIGYAPVAQQIRARAYGALGRSQVQFLSGVHLINHYHTPNDN